MVELTKEFSTIKEGLMHFSDFLELRSTVGRHEAEITSLRQARFDMSPTLSRGSAEGSRAPVPVYSGDRSTLSNFLKLFQTWTWTHDVGNALVTSEPNRVVGRERAELESVLRTTSEARVNRRLRRYYLIVLLLPNIFTLASLLLSSIYYDTGHLMMV